MLNCFSRFLFLTSPIQKASISKNANRSTGNLALFIYPPSTTDTDRQIHLQQDSFCHIYQVDSIGKVHFDALRSQISKIIRSLKRSYQCDHILGDHLKTASFMHQNNTQLHRTQPIYLIFDAHYLYVVLFRSDKKRSIVKINLK